MEGEYINQCMHLVTFLFILKKVFYKVDEQLLYKYFIELI